jgi:hypothetical protein
MANYRKRYKKADRVGRAELLNEFCTQTGYHRKYAIALLGRPADEAPPSPGRRRGVSYSVESIRVLRRIWESSGYPWSVRLKALLPQWLPWARRHIQGVSVEIEEQLLAMSPRQMDRRLAEHKFQLKRRLYGHTKPGTLLKSQIPIRTDNWDVHTPGFLEIDLVVHCGPSASGEFICSLNATDIHTQWTETRAIMGKGEAGVVCALEEIRQRLPFALKAIDSDNGSEFINHHLKRWCKKLGVAFTRSRPYKKDDNAHIEQKNWTHVRKIMGWDRYDTPEQCAAMNALYREDLYHMMNFFQPCVKLLTKIRVGSRVRRYYETPQTPLDRLAACYAEGHVPLVVQKLLAERENLDPFTLSSRIDVSLRRLARMTAKRGPRNEKQIV